MKKLIALLLAFVMVMSLVACGAKETTPEAKPEEKPEAAATSGAEGATETATLKVGCIPGSVALQMQTLADGFMAENPNVKVEVIEFEETTYQQQGAQILTADENGLDVTWYWRDYHFDLFCEENVFAPINDVYEQVGHAEAIGKDIAPLFMNNGDYYAILLDNVWISNVYYNMDLMDANGWTIPTTWDEFVQLCADAKAAGLTPLAAVGKGAFAEHQILPCIMRTMGGEDYATMCQPGQTSIRYDDPRWLEAWELLKFMTENVYQEGIAGADTPTARAMFMRGESLMFMDGSWAVVNIQQDDPNFNFDYGMLPTYKDDVPAQIEVYPGNIVAALSRSTQLDLAKQFVAYCGSAEGQSLLAPLGTSPARGDISAEAKKAVGPYVAKMYENIEAHGTKMFYSFLLPSEFTTEIINIAGGVLAGSITPDDACAQAQAAFERVQP